MWGLHTKLGPTPSSGIRLHEVDTSAARGTVDDRLQAPQACLLFLGAHDPVNDDLPIASRLCLEERGRCAIRAKLLRQRRIERHLLPLVAVNAAAFGVARFEGPQTGRPHPPERDQLIDAPDVDRAPDAATFPGREADRPALLVEATANPIDPAVGERLVEGVPVGEPVAAGVLLVEADQDFLVAMAVRVEPGAKVASGS